MNTDAKTLAPLTPVERQALKGRAHALEPTVMIGNAGLTDPVVAEIERALTRHELIKIRVLAERNVRDEIHEAICQRLDAHPVQHIGKILVVFRPQPAGEADKEPPAPRPAATMKKPGNPVARGRLRGERPLRKTESHAARAGLPERPPRPGRAPRLQPAAKRIAAKRPIKRT